MNNIKNMSVERLVEPLTITVQKYSTRKIKLSILICDFRLHSMKLLDLMDCEIEQDD